MNASASCIYEFDEFCIDMEKRVLLHNGQIVPLTPKVLETLIQLVQHHGQILKKDELMQAIWPDTVVEENNLNQNISVLRRVFKERNGNDRYILTVPGTGYRFVARVEILNGAREATSTTVGFPSSTAVVEEKEDFPLAERIEKAETKGRLKIGLAIGMPLLLLLAAFAIWRSEPQLPTVTNIVQITNDGKAKLPKNQPATDGVRLYFVEGTPWTTGSGIAQQSIVGGETTWITTSLKEALAIYDISPDRSKLLVANGAAANPNLASDVWIQPLPAGAPHRVGTILASSACWTPDGTHVVYAFGHELAIAKEDGSESRTLATVPGTVRTPRFSPDGKRVRFNLIQPQGESSSIWEMNADGRNLHLLLSKSKELEDPCCGRWSPDGEYYYFQAGHGDAQGIWVLPERRSLFHRGRIVPARLTSGPIHFGAPTPGTDGKRLFVVGDQSRVELFSFDARTHRFNPYLTGPANGSIEYSPDRKWVAYISYPDMTLWRSRPDGSEKMQLTFAPVRAYGARWSPDGSTIAFMNVQFNRPWKILLISSSGGGVPRSPFEANSGAAQTDATWAPDGKSIVFGNSQSAGEGRSAIYRLDLGTGKIFPIAGSDGLGSPRSSPDSRYICALKRDHMALMLFDSTTNQWSILAAGGQFANNEWSHDGRYVYMRENRNGNSELVRVRMKDHVLEQVIDLKDFPQLVDPYAAWLGLTPDDVPLLMRDRSVQEIYGLDLHFR